MNLKAMEQIFEDTAYIHVSGSPEELKCAQYFQDKCAELGLEAHLEAFEVDMAEIKEATLVVDGKEISCTGFKCAGNGEVEGELFYLTNTDRYSLKQCKGKIVLMDGGIGYWRYQDLLEYGAIGFITCSGNNNYAEVDPEIEPKELRSYFSNGRKMPGVNIHIKDGIELVKNKAKHAKIVLKQEEWKGQSHNVVLDLPGETDEIIVLTAHYDTVPTSVGTYDNMSGSVGLLELAERFMKEPHRYSLRFIWCGSEERGLLGSKAYCAVHEEELKKMVLNVNMDMIGCIMGYFFANTTAEDKLVHYLEYFALEKGFDVKASAGVHPSDSTPLADKGIPAVTFARVAPGSAATIHNRYDTMKVMSVQQMKDDLEFIGDFVARMANAKECPVKREIPENIKEDLDVYLNRKREKGKK